MSALYCTDEHGTPLRPPRWWIGYLTGALLTLFGIACPCGGLFAIYSTGDVPRGSFFDPPGVMKVPVATPRTLMIWVEEPRDESFLGGTPRVPTDFHVTVMDPAGKTVLTSEPPHGTGAATDVVQRVGVQLFDASTAGTYTVDVKGTFTKGQTVAVGPDQASRETAMGLGVICMLALFLLMVIGGITTLIITAVRHAKHPRVPA